MQQEANSMLTICPSFSCYSSIATKVSEEINDKTEHFGLEKEKENDNNGFEFDCVFADHEALTISADEMFSNGKIRPIFPIFKQEDRKVVVKSSRHTLIKLLNEERESYATSSESESESETIEEAVPGTFCVWKPKSNSENKKSKSSSSKRWKLKDLIQYGNTNSSNNNNNNNNESVVVLAPVSKSTKRGDQKKIAGKNTSGEVVAVKSAHELHYVRNRELKEVDKRRSYLPYRKDLVGFFANVNGLSRHLQPL